MHEWDTVVDISCLGSSLLPPFLSYSNLCMRYLQCDGEAKRVNAILFANRAAASLYLGIHDEALQDCTRSIANDPMYAKAYLRRARAHKASDPESIEIL